MKIELDILNIVAEHPETSQREIALQTGVSLGQVNFLLKKFIRDGFIKKEGRAPSFLSYHLTPKGMAEKAEKALLYIRSSYRTVITQVDVVVKLCEEYKAQGLHVHIVGSPDEMMEICRIACTRADIPFKMGCPPENDNAVVFCWEEDTERQCKDFPCVNMLKI